MSTGKVTVVHCLLHLRRQAGREVAAQVQHRGRCTASDQQSGTRTHRHAAIQAYMQVAKKTHKGTKREMGVSGNGLGNLATTISAPITFCTIIVTAPSTIHTLTIVISNLCIYKLCTYQCSIVLCFPAFSFFLWSVLESRLCRVSVNWTYTCILFNGYLSVWTSVSVLMPHFVSLRVLKDNFYG